MFYSIVLIGLIATVVFMQRQWQKLPLAERKKWLQQRLLWLVAAVVLGMVITGRAHWLMGVLAALLALLNRLSEVLRYVPILSKLFGASSRFEKNTSNQASTNKMTNRQAAEFLGIDEDASKEEITLAHKKLMQKVHPDRGGSDALAAQINEAKKVMMTRFS